LVPTGGMFLKPIVKVSSGIVTVLLAVSVVGLSVAANERMVPVTLANPAIVVLPASRVVPIVPEPDVVIEFAVITQRWDVVPSAVPIVFDEGLTPDPPEEVIPPVVIATFTDVLPTVIIVELAINPFEDAPITPELRVIRLAVFAAKFPSLSLAINTDAVLELVAFALN